MDNKIIIISVLVLFAIGVGIYFYKPEQLPENFAKISNDISSVLKQLDKTDLNHDKIMKCVVKKMKEYGIPISKFHMKGDTLAKPIVDMYNETPKLFEILGQCRYLELIGKIIGMASRKPTSNYKQFVNCLDSINWTNINVWQNISEPNSDLMYCVKNT